MLLLSLQYLFSSNVNGKTFLKSKSGDHHNWPLGDHDEQRWGAALECLSIVQGRYDQLPNYELVIMDEVCARTLLSPHTSHA